ncbi:hypothetical protein HYR54_15635 [Candidatus Acetothermia bacterium]|nr:hypothetical protein [Candidatus Acetothermia bacterium]
MTVSVSIDSRYSFVTMYGVNDLTGRYGMTANQVRDRLTLLSGVIDSHVVRGKQNAKLLTDAGLAIFDRLIQLERDGIQAVEAVKLIAPELPDEQNSIVKPIQNDSQSSNRTEQLIQQMADRIAALESDKHYLQTKLDEALAKVPALPAPKPENHQQSLNRWQALRIVMLGR